MIDVSLFLFKLLGLCLQFLKVLFDGVCMNILFLDHSVAAGDSGDKPVNLIFGHFAFFNMVLLALQMFSQGSIQHLRSYKDYSDSAL